MASVDEPDVRAAARFLVTIEPGTRPEAVGGSVEGPEDVPVVVDLFARDMSGGPMLLVELVSLPRNGTLRVVPPGSRRVAVVDPSGLPVLAVGDRVARHVLKMGRVRYYPDADYAGTDSFRFNVMGRFGEWSTNAGTFRIIMNPISDVPLASAHVVHTTEDAHADGAGLIIRLDQDTVRDVDSATHMLFLLLETTPVKGLLHVRREPRMGVDDPDEWNEWTLVGHEYRAWQGVQPVRQWAQNVTGFHSAWFLTGPYAPYQILG